MVKETLKRIFQFLEEKEKHKVPFMWKHLSGEPLTKEELTIEGDLDLEGLTIKSLPKGLTVNGSAYFAFIDIVSLPENFEIINSLFLDSTDIESLPEGLKVGVDLFLDNTYISSLPKGLKVGGNLYIGNSEIEKYSDEEIRKMIAPAGNIDGQIIRR